MTILNEIYYYFSYETRKLLKNKFIIVSLILAVYFIFASLHLGIRDGFMVMILTWSFFVLATPISDGGIILDLPLRYFAGIKMIYSEIIVWILAISINIISLIFNGDIYKKTFLLTLFKEILITPFPYGIIIVLSCIGTFLSIYFFDELYEVIKHIHRHKYNKHKTWLKMIIAVSIAAFVIILYDILLNQLGMKFI